mgnify:CR=1 FL=1
MKNIILTSLFDNLRGLDRTRSSLFIDCSGDDVFTAGVFDIVGILCFSFNDLRAGIGGGVSSLIIGVL